MKKKIILSIMLLVMVIVACVALVGCNTECTCTNCNGTSNTTTETREVIVWYNYTITEQFHMADTCIIGSIICKPENPIYIDHVFNAGYANYGDGKVDDTDMPIENPRISEGFDANKNYRFVGWYTEPEFLYQWNFSEDRVYRTMDLYAKWIEV